MKKPETITDPLDKVFQPNEVERLLEDQVELLETIRDEFKQMNKHLAIIGKVMTDNLPAKKVEVIKRGKKNA